MAQVYSKGKASYSGLLSKFVSPWRYTSNLCPLAWGTWNKYNMAQGAQGQTGLQPSLPTSDQGHNCLPRLGECANMFQHHSLGPRPTLGGHRSRGRGRGSPGLAQGQAE